MRQYNIYAGLNGGFGGASYQYTALCDNEDEAYEEAYQVACEEYDSYGGLHGLLDWDSAVEAYCEDRNLDSDNLSDEDIQSIEDMISEDRENWIEYWAIPTDEDNIVSEDLILGYIISDEDDNTSQTDSE